MKIKYKIRKRIRRIKESLPKFIKRILPCDCMVAKFEYVLDGCGFSLAEIHKSEIHEYDHVKDKPGYLYEKALTFINECPYCGRRIK